MLSIFGWVSNVTVSGESVGVGVGELNVGLAAGGGDTNDVLSVGEEYGTGEDRSKEFLVFLLGLPMNDFFLLLNNLFF